MKQLIVIGLLFFQAIILQAQTSLSEMNLTYGNYEVGFRHYITSDSTRTYQRIYDWTNAYIPRPIPVSIWYPAGASPDNQQTMTILDYMVILKEEEEWEYLPEDQILNWFYYANTPENQKHLGESTRGHLDVGYTQGEFPVVIYAPSYAASSIENFALCEFLASHGYVVISSPSRGTENRWLEGGTEKDMETQARDIEFLVKEAHHIPIADMDHLATMGFSFGGLSNVLAQVRNDAFDAIVSLDGSIKYQYAKLKNSPFFDIKKVDVPFIHMAQKKIPKQVLEEDNIDPSLDTNFEFYDELIYSKAYQLKFTRLSHSYFSSLGVLFGQRDQRQDAADEEIMASYRLVTEYTLHFLDAFLKDKTDGLEFLDNPPGNNGVPDGFVQTMSKEPESTGFSFQDWNELAADQQYEALSDLHDSLLTRHAELELPEGNLNNLGLQLVFNPATAGSGIRVLEFATYLYPESANLFDSLAEAYLYTGDNEKAIESFEKSLELNSMNQNAVNRLKQLQE